MLTDIEQIIRDYLTTVIHMSLATTNDNHPWVCEVHFAYDDSLNLYFRSLPSSRHCQEISQNKNVAGNIVQQHELGQKPRGIYFEGTGKLVANLTENHLAYITYTNRFGLNKKIVEEAQNPDGHQLYKITVDRFYVFDGRESDPSQKYELKWNINNQ